MDNRTDDEITKENIALYYGLSTLSDIYGLKDVQSDLDYLNPASEFPSNFSTYNYIQNQLWNRISNIYCKVHENELKEELGLDDSATYSEITKAFNERINSGEQFGANLMTVFHSPYGAPFEKDEDNTGTQLDQYFFKKRRAYVALCQALGFDGEQRYELIVKFFLTQPGKKWLAKKFDLDENLTWVDMLEIFREDLALRCGLVANADWNMIANKEQEFKSQKPNFTSYKPNKYRIARRKRYNAREAQKHGSDDVYAAVSDLPEPDITAGMSDLARAADSGNKEPIYRS